MADRNPDPRKEDAPVVNDTDLNFDDYTGGGGEQLDFSDAPEDDRGIVTPPLPEVDTPEASTVRAEETMTELFGKEAAKDVSDTRSSAIDTVGTQTLADIWNPSDQERVTADDIPVNDLAGEMQANYADRGGNPAALDQDMVMTEAERIARLAGGTALAAATQLAETRTWWSRRKRDFADTAAAVMAHPDFQVGLQTLDIFMWANKKSKLAFVPRESRAEIEQRVLPKVNLDDGTSYTIATGQAIENLWDRVWGANTHLNGVVVENIGKLLRSDTLQDIGQKNRNRGTKGWEQAGNRVSEAAALMGEHLTWTEVVEQNDPTALVTMARMVNSGISHGVEATDEEWNSVWAEVQQQDDIEPLMAFLGSKGTGGQALLFNWAAIDGVAELTLDPMVVAGEAIAKAPVAVQAVTKMTAPAKHAAITSKVAATTGKFEDSIVAVKAAENHLAKVKQVSAKQVEAAGHLSREQAINEVAAYRQLANERAVMGRFADVGPNEVIIPRSRRTAPDHPSVDMKVTEEYTQVYPAITDNGNFAPVEIKTTKIRQKNVSELAEELHEIRVKELGRDADLIAPRDNQIENLPLFGMDDAEQAGDALNHITRTGGIGIDDVWMHPTNPHAWHTPDGGAGLIDWRALDAANDVTKTERQFLSSGGARQHELGVSTRRSVHRQLDIAKRNYGKARASGDKAKVKVYEAEMKAAKENLRLIKDDDFLIKQDKAMPKNVREQWLGDAPVDPMANPKTFHDRLNTFGDHMLATAYPGGFGVQSFLRSRVGQTLIPLREPQRFYETFSPQTWDRVQGLYTRYHQENRAWNESLIRNGEAAGVLTKRSKWNPANVKSRHVIDEKKNEQLFDLLNTRRDDTEAWAKVSEGVSDELMKFHDDLRGQMDHWADVQGIGKGPDQPRYLEGYMRHALTADQFAGGARPLEYIGVPRSAQQFASHLLPRSGNAGFRKDAMAVLDLYGRASQRKLLIEPMFDEILASGAELAKKHKNPIMQQYANDLVAELGGKPTPWMARIDQYMGWAHETLVPTMKRRNVLDAKGKPTGDMTKMPKLAFDRKWEPGAIDRSLTGLSGLLWAGTLPGNPRYGLMQIATGIATTSGRYGLYRTAKGLFMQASKEGRAVSKASGVYDEFVNIFESGTMRRFNTALAEKGVAFGPLGPMSTGMAEEFIRGMTFHAAVDMHMTKLGISSFAEAAQMGFARRIAFEAVKSSTEVNHMFGAMGRSPMMTRGLFQSKGVATASTQFLSFMPKQTEELVSQFNRNPGNIARYMAMSGYISRIAAQTGGIDVTNYVGFGYLPTNPTDDFRSPLMDTLVESLGLLYAAGQGDRRAMSMHWSNMAENIDNVIPMMVAYESTTKSLKRALTGQDISRAGTLNRSLDLGGFDLQDPKLEDFLGGFGPSGLRDQEEGHPSVGGDLGATVFMQQSINDRLFRRGKAAMEDTIDRYLFDVQVKVRQLSEAIQDDDIEAAEKVIQNLSTDYNVHLDVGKALENRIYSENVGAVLRTLIDRSPKAVKAQVYDQIQTHGLRIE